MNRLTPALLAIALWQILRFVILCVFFLTRIAEADGREAVPWFLLFGAGSLVVPAGLVLVAIDPHKYAPLLGLMRLGKALELLPGVALLGIGVSQRHLPTLGNSTSLVVVGIALFDLIFLVILLSYKLPCASCANTEETIDE